MKCARRCRTPSASAERTAASSCVRRQGAETTNDRVVVTGAGAICAAGKSVEDIFAVLAAGRSEIAPIAQWDSSSMRHRLAGEVRDFDPRALVADRKTHKLIRRTDFLGLAAAAQAIGQAGVVPYREGLTGMEAEAFDDGTGVFVGSGGSSYQDQYDFVPLLARAAGDMRAFGRDLQQTVHPTWLLRSLPNNVLCHVGITYGFKGPNACITNHSASGALALIEAISSLREGAAERALAVAHEAPVEPERVNAYAALGLLSDDAVRPFDARRSGTVLGEGAAALFLETEASARARGAPIIAELLGGACVSEAEGLLPVREDGDGPARAIDAAFRETGIGPADVAMVVAHGNGTVASDASEAAALRRVFGDAIPRLTAFKWAFGHLLAASGLIETALAIEALRKETVPGVATTARLDAEWADLPLLPRPVALRGDVALVLCRGFGGVNVALLIRSLPGVRELRA